MNVYNLIYRYTNTSGSRRNGGGKASSGINPGAVRGEA